MREVQTDGAAGRWKLAALEGDLGPLIDAGLSRRLATLLLRRGVRSAADARHFLEPDLSQLHDPHLLPGVSLAVERLLLAVRNQQKIAIVGDYDVDGVTATALLVAVFRACGLEAHPILPERLIEGYGFQPVHAEEAHREGCRLVITADCGSTSVEAAVRAIELGMDVIVTDHHLGGDAVLPPGVIEVNPHRTDSVYPFPSLSGAGVVFKLVGALLAAVELEVSVDALLRVACLGTICDLVPLRGENRVIAAKGLATLSETRSVGLWSLMNRAAVNPPVTAVDVGFRIGPRLNAAGRLASPKLALNLLLTTDKSEGQRLAEDLDNLNRQRQQAEVAVVEDAEAKIRALDILPPILVAWSEHWHPGVLGIAAGRIARTFNRPSLLLTVEDDLAKGSGRSIPSIHLFDFLSRWRSEYVRFGGHAQAIGITVRSAELEPFRDRWQVAASEDWDPEAMIKTFDYELELKPNEVTGELLAELENLQPFGMGNRQPVLKVGPLRLSGTPRRFGRGHLSVQAKGPASERVNLLGWGWQDREAQLEGDFELLATLEKDRYHGGPVLRLVDARPAE